MDYGPYRADPRDPRTPDVPDRYDWEEEISLVDQIDEDVIDEVLFELLHGKPEIARSTLDSAIEARWKIWLREGQAENE